MNEEELHFKCDFCENSFFNEQILILHIKSNHKSIIQGWMKCDFCDKTYLTSSLSVHVKMIHSNAENHLCEICNKVFLQKKTLDNHKKAVHEGMKVYKCNSCDKEYTCKSSLMRHISVIHENKKHINRLSPYVTKSRPNSKSPIFLKPMSINPIIELVNHPKYF